MDEAMQKLFLDPLEIQIFDSIHNLQKLWMWKLVAESQDQVPQIDTQHPIVESLNVVKATMDFESLFQSLMDQPAVTLQQASTKSELEKSEEGLAHFFC
jgi:hypothetical protein